MNTDLTLLRATADTAASLARLDALVARAAPGMPTLLLLRSAQSIVAAEDRPLRAPVDGAPAFAALLGWWYAPESREFIADDPHLRGVARALALAADRVRGGHGLTPGVLDDALREGGLEMRAMPDVFAATLRAADAQAWPPLVLAAELSAGACGRVRGVRAAIARAAAPLSDGLMAGPHVLPVTADDVTGALHALADAGDAARRRVSAYHGACVQAAARCREFGRGSASALALLDALAAAPAMTVAGVSTALGLTIPTAGAAVDRLMAAGLLREITGRGRDRVFVYEPAIALAG